MVSILRADGRPIMLVEITDEHQPQGWHWGEQTPGLLPGLSLMPMKMIGQAIDTTLAIEVTNEEDIPLAVGVVNIFTKRILQGKRTMWALDRRDDQLHLGIYLPNMDAVDAIHRAFKRLPEWDESRCQYRMRIFA